MEGFGYWIFLAVLYFLSVYIKKRQKQASRGQGEEVEREPEAKPQSEFLQQIFGDFPEQFQEPIPDPDEEVELVQEAAPEKPPPSVKTVVYAPQEKKGEEPAEIQADVIHGDPFKIYQRKENIYFSLFKDLDAVRKAIVLKEILDKPRALRPGIR